jgi:predicted AAA+ superfamily ATPase
MISRNIFNPVLKILNEYGKMAFISGPRQVGKTTLAQSVLDHFNSGYYFNWDDVNDQKKLAHTPYFFEQIDKEPEKPFLIIFDEIHKYQRWKNYIKGVYDKYNQELKIIVSGSGRLDMFKKGGDSLLGRYFQLPLFPLTLGELHNNITTFQDFTKSMSTPDLKPDPAAYEQLFTYSGFPEPFLRSELAFYNIWFNERKRLLIREDIRDATNIRKISLMDILSALLPERIGSPLSINSLREDLNVAFETIRDWINILSQFYYIFQISPYSRNVKRALRKEKKIYLYDWVEVTKHGFRFENMIALHLYKAVNIWRSTGCGQIDLFYIRDKEKREVDFVITKDKDPVTIIECKYNNTDPSASLQYFQNMLKTKTAVQLVNTSGVCRKLKTETGNLWIISADRWLRLLP